MPLGPRLRPPTIPSRIDLAQREGYFYVQNVHASADGEPIEPGSVKRLRVVESPEKRFWTQPAWDGGTGQQAPGMAWDDFNNKRILGTAAVEPDGSAYFAVPADTFVYFQLLDANGMLIHSMRSGTIVRPGETSGCVGCHERRHSTPQLECLGAAWQRGPQRLEPWYGPARLFSYTAEVQPVFDEHCVSCHDYDTEGGKMLNLAGDLGLVFNTSYVELRNKGYVRVVGAGPFETQRPSRGAHTPAPWPASCWKATANLRSMPNCTWTVKPSTGFSPGSISTLPTTLTTPVALSGITPMAARRWTATSCDS